MNNTKIIYYYQTFIGLDDLFKKENIPVTHIHVSSVHFGLNYRGEPYIHLNDDSPDTFVDLWKELGVAVSKGIKIVLMIGGAGGGYSSLFSDYNTYFKLLVGTIRKYKHIISGVDLDIEEFVEYDNVIKLIKDIKKTFGEDFSISMAPIQQSLQTDTIGLGGFCYKNLFKSEVGKYIDYFCVQFYENYTMSAFDDCVKNGYPPEMLVMGMLSGMDYEQCKAEIYDTSHKYGDKFGGVYNWEYYSSPPYGRKDPSYWAYDIYNEIHKIKKSEFKLKHKIKSFFNFF